MLYDLELNRIKEEVKQKNPRKILLHLPCGLKLRSQEIKKAIEEVSEASVIFWAGSNFGACDIPFYTERFGVDMIITFGHSKWVYQ